MAKNGYLCNVWLTAWESSLFFSVNQNSLLYQMAQKSVNLDYSLALAGIFIFKPASQF
jgi:hypothetical protein